MRDEREVVSFELGAGISYKNSRDMEAKFIENLKEALEMEGKEIKWNDAFRDYEEWNSLKELSVLAMLDSEFGIELEMKDFNNLIKVGDLYEFVKSHSK
jgi:acyl carrier protein